MHKNKISVVIITYNEQEHIACCIDSVKSIADEIIVLDSYSTDATIDIAKAKGAIIHQQAFKGYGVQKNDANAFAKYEWILSLDADEYISDALQSELLNWKNCNATYECYKFPRLNNYMGVWLRYGGWYPDAKIRLFRKDSGAWVAQNVHEYWKPSMPQQPGEFRSDILHKTIGSIAQHLQKIEKYSELSALDAVAKGKRIGILKANLGALWFFVHRYFIRLGFLDGKMGFFACVMVTFEKWLKYQKIRLYTHQKK